MATVPERMPVPQFILPSGVIQCPVCESRAVVLANYSARHIPEGPRVRVDFLCLAHHGPFSILFSGYTQHSVVEVRTPEGMSEEPEVRP